MEDGAFVHAVISSNVPIIASMGDIESGWSRDGQANSGTNGRVPAVGFDRLRLLGLSGDEIAAFRVNFRGNVDELIPRVERLPNEDNSVYRGEIVLHYFRGGIGNSELLLFVGRLEDAWIATQGPYSEFSLNLPSNIGLYKNDLTEYKYSLYLVVLLTI